MNESQRAMVAAKLATMTEGRPTETRSIDLVSQDAAAEMLNVSVPSVKRAKKVQESGDASLIADVESGKVTVSAAAQHVAAVQRYPECGEAFERLSAPKGVVSTLSQNER